MPLTRDQIAARLHERREALGLTQAEVARELGVHRPTISEIEAGRRALSTDELLRLSRIYVIRLGDLLAEDAPADRDMARVLLRGRKRDNTAIRRAHAWLGERFRTERELEELIGWSGRPDPRPSYRLDPPADRGQAVRQGEALSAQERRRLELGVQPIRNPLELLEAQGVRIAPLPDLDPGLDIDAIYFESEELGACIGLRAPRRPWDVFRTTFTAAHEYAHWLLRDVSVEAFSYEGGTEDLIEVRANAFAAAFLMPREGLARYLEGAGLLKGRRIERLSPGDIVYAMNYFGVSRPAFLYRLGNIGLLDEETRDRLLRELGDFSITGVARRLGIRIHEYKDVDIRFRQLVREAWRRGRITTGRAAGLLEVDIEHFRSEMRGLGEEVQDEDDADLPLVGAAAG